MVPVNGNRLYGLNLLPMSYLFTTVQELKSYAILGRNFFCRTYGAFFSPVRYDSGIHSFDGFTLDRVETNPFMAVDLSNKTTSAKGMMNMMVKINSAEKDNIVGLHAISDVRALVVVKKLRDETQPGTRIFLLDKKTNTFTILHELEDADFSFTDYHNGHLYLFDFQEEGNGTLLGLRFLVEL